MAHKGHGRRTYQAIGSGHDTSVVPLQYHVTSRIPMNTVESQATREGLHTVQLGPSPLVVPKVAPQRSPHALVIITYILGISYRCWSLKSMMRWFRPFSQVGVRDTHRWPVRNPYTIKQAVPGVSASRPFAFALWRTNARAALHTDPQSPSVTLFAMISALLIFEQLPSCTYIDSCGVPSAPRHRLRSKQPLDHGLPQLGGPSCGGYIWLLSTPAVLTGALTLSRGSEARLAKVERIPNQSNPPIKHTRTKNLPPLAIGMRATRLPPSLPSRSPRFVRGVGPDEGGAQRSKRRFYSSSKQTTVVQKQVHEKEARQIRTQVMYFVYVLFPGPVE